MAEVEKILAKKESCKELDPSGFFVIMVDPEKEEIILEHYINIKKDGDPRDVTTGKLNKVVVGTDAESISRTVIRERLVSQLDHANYLGRELQKAEIALKQRAKYEQDDPLVFD